MNIPKNAVVWFEIPVTDFDRAKKFYSEICDYEMPEQIMGPSRMGFFLMNHEKGGIGGAIIAGEGYTPGKTGTKVYLQAGDDLTSVLDKIESAEGKVILPKTLITEEIGYFVIFEDTEGNHVCLHSRN